MLGMLDSAREEKILAILKEQNTCTIYGLAQALFVSESTMRRDLTKMEQKGLVTRTFGGVVINSDPSNQETSVFLREKQNLKEKRSLAHAAASYLHNQAIVFLDSSTTSLQIVSMLNAFKGLVIITNGVLIANELALKTKHHITLVGGTILPSTKSTLGSSAEEMLRNYHADFAIMSTAALDVNFGFSEQVEDQSRVKQIMIANANQSIVMVDHSKFDKISLYRTCGLSDVDVVLYNGSLDPKYAKMAPDTTFCNVDSIH